MSALHSPEVLAHVEYTMRVLKASGFLIETFDMDDLSIDTDMWTFCLNPDGSIELWRWTGSYPFAVDHEMGAFPSAEDAARYVVWWHKQDWDKYLRMFFDSEEQALNHINENTK